MQYFWGVRGTDDIVLHRVNNNPSGSGGGSYDKNFYHLTDTQFSTLVIVDQHAKEIERISYDAYGRPRHHPLGDLDGDGMVRADEHQLMFSLGAGTVADLNRDGVVNGDDRALMGANLSISLAHGVLSFAAVDNQLGYAGYIYHAEMRTYLARHRWFDPELGRWLQRDPAGYVDGMNLYLYGLGSPFVFVDPWGLFSGWFNNLCEGAKGLIFGSETGAWDRSQEQIDQTRLGHQERLIAKGKMTEGQAAAQNAYVQEGIDASADAELALTQARMDAAAAMATLVPGGQGLALALTAGSVAIDVSQGNYGAAALNLLPGAGGEVFAKIGAKALGNALKSGADDLAKNVGRGNGVQPFQVGTIDQLQRTSRVGDNLALHHAGQSHPMRQVVQGYDPRTAPAIALPTTQHRAIPNVRGTYVGSPRSLLANDIRNLRNFTDAPNASLRNLIRLNKTLYPTSFGP